MGEWMAERMPEIYQYAEETVRPTVLRIAGAALGALAAWFTGLPVIAQALLMVQAADILTGLLAALMGRSPKTQSGKVSSKALTEGMIKKGLEWLVVLICAWVGTALGLDGIAGAAMTYMMTTEMVSLMENLSLFGLEVPVLQRLLDIAQKKNAE